jgi:signal transduction histidine kinase/ActR/RegA family two-component response regulator
LTNQTLADLILLHRDQVVSRFVAETKQRDLSPPGTARSLLADHIPGFLDGVVAELVPGRTVRESQDTAGTSETARRHGGQRWTLGYDLDGLVREYGVLRQAIMATAKASGVSPTIDEFEVLAQCLNAGIAEATAEYGRHRDAELSKRRRDVEFLAEAGQLLTSSLDYTSTLAHVTGLIVPNLADWCAVIVEGSPPEQTPIASVDPVIGDVLREILRRFPPDPNSDFGHPAVLRTGTSQLAEEMPVGTLERIARSPEHLSLLRQLRARSLITVPLRVQSSIFGAITLAWSASPRRYGPDDLALIEELARRAAVAIDNAHLYASSQNERSRVEAATRAQDEFVAMVSHELRTPLNSILGWLQLLQGGALPENKREHAIDVSIRNARALDRLVGDLLDIGRVITGKMRIKPSQLDLNGVVEMAIEGVRPAAEAKRIRLVADLGGEDAVMRGDGDRLQQVVWNLLANAVKFSPKGGVVGVRVGRVDSDFELSVADDGAGIAPEFLPHVFETFRQFEGGTTRAHGGLGIGLSIAKHIVELHGGSIEARSPGLAQGSTFVVRLPISPLGSSTLGVSRVQATKVRIVTAPPAVGVDGVRGLVVDDEPDARELVACVLEMSRIEVRAVASVADALKELEAYTPHVIVSDIGMPDEDGYVLIRRIRTLAAKDKRDIPVIALTAFARNEDRTRALVEGFNLHMTKPVEPAALVKAVADLAGQGRMSRRT